MTDITDQLREDNPKARLVDLMIYADALNNWFIATVNVRQNGAVCAHPRTGAPMMNPYLAVQAGQIAIIGRYPRINSDRVMNRLSEMSAEP